MSNIPIELISNQPVNDKIETSDSSVFSEFEYVLRTLYSNFEKNLIRTPFVLSENNSLQNTTQSKEIIIKTQSQFYGDDEIEIMIEIIPSQFEFSYDKTIKITTMDKSTDSIIQNVTYLMTIIKNEKSLFTNYFFAEDELLIQVNHNDDENITISGERMYELDALIMNSDNPITISGIFFDLNSTYEFDISLRTIHNPDNFIFLNGFHAEITP